MNEGSAFPLCFDFDQIFAREWYGRRDDSWPPPILHQSHSHSNLFQKCQPKLLIADHRFRMKLKYVYDSFEKNYA